MKRKVLAALFTGMLVSSAVLPAFSIYAEEAAVEDESSAEAEVTAEVDAEAETETAAEIEEEVEIEEVAGTISSITLESGNPAFVYVPQGESIDVGHNAT